MKLGLLGINTITQLVINILAEKNTPAECFAFDDDTQKHNKSYFGIPVRGTIQSVSMEYENNRLNALVVCLGEKHLKLRKEFFTKYQGLGIPFPNFINASCILSSKSHIGHGNVLYYGVIVGHNTEIKNNSVVWAGTVIEHDCIIHGH